jgi:hypothetical protein
LRNTKITIILSACCPGRKAGVCPWLIVCDIHLSIAISGLAVDAGHTGLSSEATQGYDMCGLLIVSAPKIPATSLPNLIRAVRRERRYGRATSRTPKKACWLPGNRAVDIRWSELQSADFCSSVELSAGWEYRLAGREIWRKEGMRGIEKWKQ